MKIFDQRGENLREIKSVMVTGNYNKNNYIQNVFWARGIDEESTDEQAGAQKKMNTNQMVFIQNGNNSTQTGSVGTLTIKHGD